MVYFHFLAAILTLISLPHISHQSLSSQTSAAAAVISAAPALLPDGPHYADLSPDIAPLFPSPGRADVPTIPSSRSVNPDAVASMGPDSSAFGPTGPFQESASVSAHRGAVGVGVFCGCSAYWLVMLLFML